MVEFFNCPLLEMQKIDFDENHLIFGHSIIEFIEQSISQKKFVLLMADRKYIKKYDYSSVNLHQLLIHGYDDDKKIFHYSDHDKSGRFINDLECSYKELCDGFCGAFRDKNEPDFAVSVFTFKVNENQEYHVNLIRIRRMILNYMNCISYSDDFRSSGIGVYRALIDYYTNALNDSSYINPDIRGLFVLLDHHEAMLFRLKKIDGLVNINPDWIKGYVETVKKSRITVNLLVKYRMTSERNIINRVVSLLEEIYLMEKNILSEMIQFL